MKPARIPLALLALLLGACVAPPQAGPALRVPEAEFLATPSLCLLSLQSEAGTKPERLAQLQEQLAAALRSRGYGVVGVEETVAVLERVSKEEGGYYDPYTGERDESRYASVSSRVRQRVASELGCPAWLAARVVLVISHWSNGTAQWDGASDSIGGGFGAYGTVGALSLWVRVSDSANRELFFGTGGIQTAGRLNEGFFTSHFEQVSAESLLADDARFRTAIELALEGLPARPATTGAGAP
jgi:hypothetical protein